MNKEKKRKIVAIVKLVILGIILIGIPLYIYLFQRELIKELSNFDNIKGYFEAHKIGMVFFCLLAQCIQIVISIIPGQWIQIGAGYFYGVVVAYGISVIGAILGSVITYYIAKKLGRDAMYLFFKEEQIENLIKMLNSKKAMIIIFLIYLIPGVPKDLCNYAAGLSSMKFKPFLLVSILGRTPGMMGSIIIGRQLYTHSYTSAIIIGVAASVCFVLGIIYRNKVNGFLDNMYDKYLE